MKRTIYTGRVSPTQAKRAEKMQAVADALSLLANIVMLLTILGLGFIGGGDAQTEALMALVIAALWLGASVIYVIANNRRTGRTLMGAPTPT